MVPVPYDFFNFKCIITSPHRVQKLLSESHKELDNINDIRKAIKIALKLIGDCSQILFKISIIINEISNAHCEI
jgi:hypothetical protein